MAAVPLHSFDPFKKRRAVGTVFGVNEGQVSNSYVSRRPGSRFTIKIAVDNVLIENRCVGIGDVIDHDAADLFQTDKRKRSVSPWGSVRLLEVGANAHQMLPAPGL